MAIHAAGQPRAADRQPPGQSVFRERIIRIAVQPPLSGFRRRDDGMLARSHVFGGVAIRRRVAAERDAARLAGSKMDPAGADLDALLAFTPGGVTDGGD